jgi:hypothetical protein
MTPTEAVMFVRQVGAVWPQQRMEDGTPDAWYAAGLKDVSHADAAEAITRLAKFKTFISLAEILTEVKRLREDRIAQHAVINPHGEVADDPRGYREALGATITRIADGLAVRKALTRGGGSQPSEEYNRSRGADRDPVRVASMAVPCPWPACKAAKGAACTDACGRRLKVPAHDGRLVKAGLAKWVEINGVPRAVMLDEAAAVGETS